MIDVVLFSLLKIKIVIIDFVLNELCSQLWNEIIEGRPKILRLLIMGGNSNTEVLIGRKNMYCKRPTCIYPLPQLVTPISLFFLMSFLKNIDETVEVENGF